MFVLLVVRVLMFVHMSMWDVFWMKGIQMSKEELDYDETKSIGGTTAIVVWREL